MKLRSISSLGAALAVAGVLAGCGSSVKLDDAPVESRTGSAVGSSGGTGGQAQSQVSTVNLTGQNGQGDAASQLARVVYFDFDSYVVKDEYRPVVSSYAKVMAGGQKRLTIAATLSSAQTAPRTVRIDELVTTKDTLQLAALLDEDSTFFGDLFAHVVDWQGDLYLEDGLHRALRAALQQRNVLHAGVHVIGG